MCSAPQSTFSISYLLALNYLRLLSPQPSGIYVWLMLPWFSICFKRGHRKNTSQKWPSPPCILFAGPRKSNSFGRMWKRCNIAFGCVCFWSLIVSAPLPQWQNTSYNYTSCLLMAVFMRLEWSNYLVSVTWAKLFFVFFLFCQKYVWKVEVGTKMIWFLLPAWVSSATWIQIPIWET